MPDPLKLIAVEADDMEIISAATEGLITSAGEMSFLKPARAFTVIGSRFKWEEATAAEENSRRSWRRIRSGLYIGDVTAVKAIGITREKPTEILELLSLSTHVENDLKTEITLIFAGGSTLRITAECVNVTLTDTGEAWETDKKPSHDDAPGPDQDK